MPVEVEKSDLLATVTVTTVNNNDISVSAWFKWWEWIYQVFLKDDNEVTAFDIIASNGIIHVIDRVLKPTDNIIEVAKLFTLSCKNPSTACISKRKLESTSSAISFIGISSLLIQISLD